MSVRVVGLQRAFDGASERMQRVAVAVASEMAQEGARHIKELMEGEGTKDTGLTAQSVRAQPARVVAPGLARADVSVEAQQLAPAVVLEDGRRPGKPVSAEGQRRIGVWLRRKGKRIVDSVAAEMRKAHGRRRRRGDTTLTLRQAAEERAAFLVARAIRRRGLRAHRYFFRARIHLQNRAVSIYKRVLARLPRTGGAR